MPRVLFTTRSGNRKTGPIPVGMTDRSQCPTSCRLYQTCYARGGMLGATWSRLNNGKLPGMDWGTFCRAVRDLGTEVRLWRMNQAGDLPGCNNGLDREACLQLTLANAADHRNRGGFTYTHYSPLPGPGVDPGVAAHNAAVIRCMNAGGFIVNLSADSLPHADQLADLGIGPVVTVLPRDQHKGTRTPQGRVVVICPAVTRGATCQTCGICQRERKVIVGFPAHGFARHKLSDLTARLGAF